MIKRVMGMLLAGVFLLQYSVGAAVSAPKAIDISGAVSVSDTNGGKIKSRAVVDEYQVENIKELPTKMVTNEDAEALEKYKADVTAVQDQNPLGTCWTFATFGNLESFLKKKNGKEYNFSENHLKYAMTDNITKVDIDTDSKTYDRNKYGYDLHADSGGNFTIATAYLTRNTIGGPVYEENDPYDASRRRDLSITKNMKKSNIYVTQTKMLGDVNFAYNEDEWWKTKKYRNYTKAIKEMIYKYGAVYSSYYSHENSYYEFYDEDTGNTSLAYLSNLRNYAYPDELMQYMNHAITIVGWDDNFSKEKFHPYNQPDKNGAFLVKNSWGTEWGDAGYFWISYEEYLSETCASIKTTTRSSLYNQLYEYDPLGLTDTYTYSDEKLVFMNRFTRKTKNQQKINAVSSYFLQKGTKVNVYVSPTRDRSKLKWVAGRTINNPGFQVISWKEPVLITDSKFLVAIMIEHPDGVKAAVEDRWTNFTSQATASSGQGYVGYSIKGIKNGDYWDLTQMTNTYMNPEGKLCKKTLSNANFCIKAYTKNTGKTLKDISKAKITKIYNKKYTGKLIKQDPLVKYNGTKLKKGRDYRLIHSNNKKRGTATVTIVGNGNYCGSVVKKFKIK